MELRGQGFHGRHGRVRRSNLLASAKAVRAQVGLLGNNGWRRTAQKRKILEAEDLAAGGVSPKALVFSASSISIQEPLPVRHEGNGYACEAAAGGIFGEVGYWLEWVQLGVC